LQLRWQGDKKKNHINSGYLKKIYVKLRLVIMKNLQAMLMQGGDLNKKKMIIKKISPLNKTILK
jgi:hypothetical protein